MKRIFKSSRLITLLAGFCLFCLVCTLWASGRIGKEGPVGGQKQTLRIVTTTGMIADMVRQLTSEIPGKVQVDSLMGPGIDPHAYQASHGDIAKLREADIVLYNGLSLEGKMEKILEGLAQTKPVVAISTDLDKKLLLAAEDYEDAYDPHIWFDLELWSAASDTVCQILIKSLPESYNSIEMAHQAYEEKLSALDSWAKSEMSSIPERQRILITAHDAFRYLGRRYSVKVEGLQGISSASDYGLQDIKRLKDLIIGRGVKAVFVESSVPKRFIISLQEAVRAAGGEVSVGGTLYSDALGEPGSGAETLHDMFRENLTTIKKGLL